MKRRITAPREEGSRAFTLLELLLVVVIIVMLLGAMVFNFSNLLRGYQLEEGTNRLETLMRYARAQAANSGRKVQLVFDAESTNTVAASTGEVRATWEPDPLGQPGLFADLVEAQWHVQEINNLVQVESVKLLDASAACPPGDVSEEEESEDPFDTLAAKPMPPITFYPDGSSDSAEIIVAARSPEEEQRMAVRLVGLTGSISRQPVASDLENALWDTEFADQPELVPERTFTPDFQTRGETTSARPATRDASRSSRPTQPAPRAPVGGTNSVDSIR